MNRRGLAETLADKLSVTQAGAIRFAQAREETTTEALESDGSLILLGFGTFSTWEQIKWAGRNPKSGVVYMIRARKGVKFRPGKLLLKQLNASLSKWRHSRMYNKNEKIFDMKRILFLVSLLVAMIGVYGQKFVVKSNLLYNVTATVNLGVEAGLAKKWSPDLSGNYNGWKFGDEVRMKHWLVQPEARYWSCEKFNGHFFGLHVHYADYNAGGLKFLSKNMGNHRYQGNLYGAGLSYDYQWLLSGRWSMEVVLGIGWAYLDYNKYPCATCGTVLKDETKDYFGAMKAATSIIYFIK